MLRTQKLVSLRELEEFAFNACAYAYRYTYSTTDAFEEGMNYDAYALKQ